MGAVFFLLAAGAAFAGVVAFLAAAQRGSALLEIQALISWVIAAQFLVGAAVSSALRGLQKTMEKLVPPEN